MKLIYKCICLVLGAVLGAGCDSDTGGDPVEYGMPHGTLRIDGHVRDEQGEPIAGVRVAYASSEPDTTDSNGAWSIEDDYAWVSCAEGDTTTCVVRATDIDGTENGEFEDTVVPLDLEQTAPGEGWYEGVFEQHDIDVVLPEKEPAEKKDGPAR